MIYPYMTLPDETETVFTNVFEEDGVKKWKYILNALQTMALILPVVSCQAILGLLGKVFLKKK